MKKIAIKISSAFLLAGMMLPMISFADMATTTNNTNKIEVMGTTSNFCTKIDAYIVKADNRLGEKDSDFQSRKADQSQKLAEKQADRDGKLEKNRSTWSEKRDTEYTKLSKKAITDVQKQAVATFQTTMQNAIKTQRASIDTAIATYRSGLASTTASRKTMVDTALKILKADTDTVLAKAKADCASGILASTVKTQTMAGLKTAQDKFKASIKDSTQMKADMKALNDAKKMAFDKAMADFKATADKARADLKVAFA